MQMNHVLVYQVNRNNIKNGNEERVTEFSATSSSVKTSINNPESLTKTPRSTVNKTIDNNHAKSTPHVFSNASNDKMMDNGLEWDSGEFDGTEERYVDKFVQQDEHIKKSTIASSKSDGNVKGLSKIELMKLQMERDGVTSSKSATKSNEGN